MTTDGFTVRVKGAKELRKKLKKIAGDLDDMKDVHRAAAELVKTEALSRAPRKSGALAAGIKTGVTQTKATIRSGSVGKSKNYAARQHWKQQDGKPGEEYVYKAVGAMGRQVVKLYYDRVDDLVDGFNRSGTRGTF